MAIAPSRLAQQSTRGLLKEPQIGSDRFGSDELVLLGLAGARLPDWLPATMRAHYANYLPQLTDGHHLSAVRRVFRPHEPV